MSSARTTGWSCRLRRAVYCLLCCGVVLALTARATAETPFLVTDINITGASSSPHELTDVNGTLFFSASDDTHGTDPTPYQHPDAPKPSGQGLDHFR